jgi:dienelactone hydrolase
MQTETIGVNVTARDWSYRDLGTPLTGVLFRDESPPGMRPGVLLVHGGAGLDEHARQQARRYAFLGYTADSPMRTPRPARSPEWPTTTWPTIGPSQLHAASSARYSPTMPKARASRPCR